MAVVIYAYQVADLFHIGHGKALEQAKALGDYLIVGVLTDEAAEAYKRKPVIPFTQRMYMVHHFDCVDMVVIQETLDPTENLKIIRPDIVVHGDDWDENFPGAEYMRSIGKQAIRTKYTKNLILDDPSTTKIIEEIRCRQLV